MTRRAGWAGVFGVGVVGALCAFVAGCACEPTIATALFPSKCSRVYLRAVESLGCPNVSTRNTDRASTYEKEFADVDSITVCCNFGSKSCAHYVCPKGRPPEACYRE